jgi:hypothetical protein
MRIKNSRHLIWVRQQGCLLCGGFSHAHHLMFAEPSAMSKKSGDNFAVPLCPKHHNELHMYGDEKTWWDLKGIDPMDWCNQYGSKQ